VHEKIQLYPDESRRLVWGAEGAALTHYNASAQVFSEGAGSRVVWLTDFLPPEAASVIGPMMEQGMAAMQKALDRLG
jgi:hypothetical protein